MLAGASVILVGAIALWEAAQYPFGTLRMIGPAVFPFGISLLLIGAGVVILISDARAEPGDGSEPEAVPWRNLCSVLAAIVVFGFLLERAGLVPAVFAGVFIASLADRSLRLGTVAVLATVLSIGCTLVFVTFLKLPISPFAM